MCYFAGLFSGRHWDWYHALDFHPCVTSLAILMPPFLPRDSWPFHSLVIFKSNPIKKGRVKRSRRLGVEKIRMDALCLKLHDLGFDLKKKMGDLNPKMSEGERRERERRDSHFACNFTTEKVKMGELVTARRAPSSNIRWEYRLSETDPVIARDVKKGAKMNLFRKIDPTLSNLLRSENGSSSHLRCKWKKTHGTSFVIDAILARSITSYTSPREKKIREGESSR